MNIDGVLVPIVTPFNANQELNLPTFEALIEKFIAEKVGGLVVCGSTGEYYALTEAERAQVLETAARVAKGRVTIIAGINSLSPSDAIKRATQAQELGYDGVLSPPHTVCRSNTRLLPTTVRSRQPRHCPSSCTTSPPVSVWP